LADFVIFNECPYLKMQCEKINVGGFVYRDLIEIKRITDIDFSLRSLFGGKLF